MHGIVFDLFFCCVTVKTIYRQLQKRERTGKECGCFRLLEKLRYSNERATKFESLNQEWKYFERENCKIVALQMSPEIESLYGLGRQATKLQGLSFAGER